MSTSKKQNIFVQMGVAFGSCLLQGDPQKFSLFGKCSKDKYLSFVTVKL